jgi:hypothetical protein
MISLVSLINLYLIRQNCFLAVVPSLWILAVFRRILLATHVLFFFRRASRNVVGSVTSSTEELGERRAEWRLARRCITVRR